MERCNAILVIQRIWRKCISRKCERCLYSITDQCNCPRCPGCLTMNDGFPCCIECNDWFPPMFDNYDDYDGKLYENWLR